MTSREKALKAYELLATPYIEKHLKGLKLLDEARSEDAEEVFKLENELDQHKVVSITANLSSTMIYLADEENNLVAQERGSLCTSVKPGIYFAQFGKKGKRKKIYVIKDDINIKEAGEDLTEININLRRIIEQNESNSDD